MISRMICKSLVRIHHLIVRFSSSGSFLRNYVVRTTVSADETREIFGVRAAAWGRKPGALDYDIYFATDNTGFYVGELDGKPIGCMAAVKFSKTFAFLGNFMVDKPYRGKGYGSSLMATGISALPKECNFAFDIHEENIPLFETQYGYKLAWKARRVSVNASRASSVVASSSYSPSVKICSARDIPLAKIAVYDSRFYNFDRYSFLQRWIYAPNCHSFAAVNSSGSVVGYSVVRSTLRQEDGWRLSPLYANNPQIAQSLYQAIFKSVAAHGDPEARITFDAPCIEKDNLAAFKLAKQQSAVIDEHIARMYRYHVPSHLPISNIFSM